MSYRTIAVLFAFVLSVRALFAAPYVYESFEQSQPGSPASQTSGEGFAGAYSAQATAQIRVGNLSYANGDILISGGTTYLELKKTTTYYVLYRLMDASLIPRDGSDIYMSFLVRVPESSAVEGDNDYFAFGLASGTSITPAFAPLLTFGSSGTVNAWGMRNGGSTVLGSESVVGGRTDFVVLKLSKKGGSYYRYCSLAINPSSTNEPGEAGWSIFENYNKDFKSSISDIKYLMGYLKHDKTDKCEDDDVFAVDEVRIGTSWADVTGPATYNGEVPRPDFAYEDGVGARMVSITNWVPGCEYYYTTDGTEPTAESGTHYDGPFAMTSSVMIRAVAVLDGKSSNVAQSVCNLEVLWTGDGEDSKWETAENWTPTAAPDGKAITFGTDGRTVEGTAGHVLSRDLSVASLVFTNNNFAPPAVDTKKAAWWQVTEITAGATLTVYGMNDDGKSVFVTAPKASNQGYCGAGFIGDGKLSVASPDSEVFVWSTSANHTGYARLDLSGLAEFDCDVSRVRIGQGSRSIGYLRLAARGLGRNLVKADAILVGDSHGTGKNSGTSGGSASELVLGQNNEIDCDAVYIAGSEPGYWNQMSGTMYFRAGLTDPMVKLRARDGLGRMSLWVGTHGQSVSVGYKSTVTGTADFSSGSVDALLDVLRVGEACGRAYDGSNNGGRVNATFRMSAGCVDANGLFLGRTRSGSDMSSTCYVLTATLDVSGGDFTVNGDAEVALNDDGGKQGLTGNVNLSGGTLSVGGDMTLATRLGLATNVIANVTVAGGTMTVLGGLHSGVITTNLDYAAQSINLSANVNALGGVIAVTNELGTSEFRLEQGTLALAGGKVYADALVLTNEASTVAVTLGADAFPTAEVGALKLGGALRAELADGVTAKAGTVWHVVSGTAAREGRFASVELPEDFRVRYTATGFDVEKKGPGMVLLVR